MTINTELDSDSFRSGISEIENYFAPCPFLMVLVVLHVLLGKSMDSVVSNKLLIYFIVE